MLKVVWNSLIPHSYYVYRLVYKKSGSCEDLTEYDIAAKQRKQDIKARKINPYEPRKLLKGELPPHKPEPPCKIMDFILLLLRVVYIYCLISYCIAIVRKYNSHMIFFSMKNIMRIKLGYFYWVVKLTCKCFLTGYFHFYIFSHRSIICTISTTCWKVYYTF